MPKGTRKIHFSFDETYLTHVGGMWLIRRFCNKLKLRGGSNDMSGPHDYH